MPTPSTPDAQEVGTGCVCRLQLRDPARAGGCTRNDRSARWVPLGVAAVQHLREEGGKEAETPGGRHSTRGARGGRAARGGRGRQPVRRRVSLQRPRPPRYGRYLPPGAPDRPRSRRGRRCPVRQATAAGYSTTEIPQIVAVHVLGPRRGHGQPRWARRVRRVPRTTRVVRRRGARRAGRVAPRGCGTARCGSATAARSSTTPR